MKRSCDRHDDAMHSSTFQPQSQSTSNSNANPHLPSAFNLTPQPQRFDPLAPIRNWLDTVEISDRRTAHLISRFIPSQCPFERDIEVFGRVIAHIPPLCKLNPLYDQFVGLRFRSLCYLADVCGEDIQAYC